MLAGRVAVCNALRAARHAAHHKSRKFICNQRSSVGRDPFKPVFISTGALWNQFQKFSDVNI